MLQINTKLTKLLSIKSPIVAAPMYFASTPELAAVVTKAGGLGFTAAGLDPPQKLKDGLQEVRTRLGISPGVAVPMGVGFLGWILDRTEVSDHPCLPVVLEEMPLAIWFAFGDDLGKYVAQVRAFDANRVHKTVVFVIVNSVKEALRAANEWNVDVLVVQGNEAGGHGRGDAPPLFTLLQAVLTALPNGPIIIAAGGISTGAQIAALLTMGADGVTLGSRFLTAPECMYTDPMKEVILDADLYATSRSYAFDDVIRTPFWPEGIDGRAVANDILVDQKQGLDVEARIKKFEEGRAKGEKNRLLVWAGVGIGLVHDSKSASVTVKELHDETVEKLRAIPATLGGTE